MFYIIIQKYLEVAVVGVPDPVFGEVVKTFIIPKADETIEKQEIKDFVSEYLANYKVPTEIQFVEEFPRNSAGKVLKAELKNLLLN